MAILFDNPLLGQGHGKHSTKKKGSAMEGRVSWAKRNEDLGDKEGGERAREDDVAKRVWKAFARYPGFGLCGASAPTLASKTPPPDRHQLLLGSCSLLCLPASTDTLPHITYEAVISRPVFTKSRRVRHFVWKEAGATYHELRLVGISLTASGSAKQY